MKSRIMKNMMILVGAGLLAVVFSIIDERPAQAQGIIRSAGECHKRIRKPRKIERCVACVRRGGWFYRDKGNRGYCRMPKRRSEPPIRTISGCHKRIRKPGKIKHCVACIRRGGVFIRNGGNPGVCRG